MFLNLMMKKDRFKYFKSDTEKEAQRFLKFLQNRNLENLKREDENRICREYLEKYYNDIEELRKFNKTISDFTDVCLLDYPKDVKTSFRMFFIIDMKQTIKEHGQRLVNNSSGGVIKDNSDNTTQGLKESSLDDNDYVTDSEFEPSFLDLSNLKFDL